MKDNKLPISDFNQIIKLINNARNAAFRAVNKELVLLHWNIGEVIFNKVNSGVWGEQIVENLAVFLKQEHPNLKGFSKRSLHRMKQFYETYYKNEKVSAVLTDLSWSNHLIILSKCKTIEEKYFYILLSIKNHLSFRDLKRQIESSTFEREMLSNQIVSTPLTQLHKSTNNVFKDTYVFEFLNLPINFSEKDLQNQIVSNLKNFLLEIGNGFSFIGQEYRVQVGLHDYYIDLLFFHRELQCLVAFELKTTEFKPEYLGKLNFYLEALDTNVKMPNEKPSIGILLCKGKDKEVVEFALRRNISPTLIADYETRLIDKKILQQKLHELYSFFDKKQEEK